MKLPSLRAIESAASRIYFYHAQILIHIDAFLCIVPYFHGLPFFTGFLHLWIPYLPGYSTRLTFRCHYYRRSQFDHLVWKRKEKMVDDGSITEGFRNILHLKYFFPKTGTA